MGKAAGVGEVDLRIYRLVAAASGGVERWGSRLQRSGMTGKGELGQVRRGREAFRREHWNDRPGMLRPD